MEELGAQIPIRLRRPRLLKDENRQPGLPQYVPLGSVFFAEAVARNDGPSAFDAQRSDPLKIGRLCIELLAQVDDLADSPSFKARVAESSNA